METFGIKTDVKQLLRLLGPAMYKDNTTAVAIKELLQNAFDAVKKMLNAQISIRVDSYQNYIECKDNGIGMSPDIVKNVYLTIGGTWKENLDESERSGGLGLAKVQFFLSASRLYVNTVKDGKRTILDCTQEELLDAQATIIVEDTDEPSGTVVRLYYPKEFTAIDGSKHTIRMPYYYDVPLLDKPLLGYPNVKVTFRGDEVCTMPKGYTHTSEWDFAWGKVICYYNPKSYKTTNSFSTPVHSAGLWQFDKRFHKQFIGYLAFRAMLDIRPKVKAGEAGYPFNNTREGFNVAVEKDIQTVSEYLFSIQKVLNAETIKLMFFSMQTLQYTDVDGSGLTDQVELRQATNKEFTEEFLDKLFHAFASCDSVFEEPQMAKEADTTISASKGEVHSDDLKFKNATNGNYTTGHSLFSKVASVVMDIIDVLPDKERTKFPKVAGIRIDKSQKGCLVSGQMSGLFINPLSCSEYMISECWAQDMVETIIHEIAHINEEWHDLCFITEMNKIRMFLIKEGHYTNLQGKLRRIYADESQAILSLSEEFNKSRNI